MPIYKVSVTYKQTFEHTVRADSREEAKTIAENLDHVGDGDYHLYDTEIDAEYDDDHHEIADND